ncbi:hypothetical protein NDU88_003043 [Pleurodeles waltl]|uniref:Uncharacterized protein n=1 Tax=Pleurodeles waltl TaxID=8319 RepID=A0AAV7Q8K6_PLEWA|nr:hypothetical protein NDU88_003043 [Pleurodeles waltl]
MLRYWGGGAGSSQLSQNSGFIAESSRSILLEAWRAGSGWSDVEVRIRVPFTVTLQAATVIVAEGRGSSLVVNGEEKMGCCLALTNKIQFPN